MHNWGTNASFTPPTSLQFSAPGINPAGSNVPQLLLRDANGFRNNTWSLQCGATTITPAGTDVATFSNGCNENTVGQFFIGVASSVATLAKTVNDSAISFRPNLLTQGSDSGKFIRIVPNPARENEPVTLQNQGKTEAQVDLYLSDGTHYRRYIVAPLGSVRIPRLPKGSVFYRATNAAGQQVSGVEIVQ